MYLFNDQDSKKIKYLLKVVLMFYCVLLVWFNNLFLMCYCLSVSDIVFEIVFARMFQFVVGCRCKTW